MARQVFQLRGLQAPRGLQTVYHPTLRDRRLLCGLLRRQVCNKVHKVQKSHDDGRCHFQKRGKHELK